MDFLCCKKFIEYFEIITQVTLYLNNFKLGTKIKIELKCKKKQIKWTKLVVGRRHFMCQVI